MKKMLVLAGVLALALATDANAARWYDKTLDTQTGGVADSMAAAADTSSTFQVPVDIVALFVTSLADTNAIRWVQVADSNYAQGSNRWATVVYDSLVAGANVPKGRTTADIAASTRGKWMRVVVDRLRSAAGWGTSKVTWQK